MINFRKLKQDFGSQILKEGKELFDKKKVLSARIVSLDADTVHFRAKVEGNFNNTYESEMEVDRMESEVIDSNCDCAYNYDCQHLAALIFYLEEHFDSLLLTYSKEKDIHQDEKLGEKEKKHLMESIEVAKTKIDAKEDAIFQKEVTEEYRAASEILASSPFFLPVEKREQTKAELSIMFNPQTLNENFVEIQLALRIASRSKPLNIPNIKEFLQAVKYEEEIFLSSRRFVFTNESFTPIEQQLLASLLNDAQFVDSKKNGDRALRVALISKEALGELLAQIYQYTIKNTKGFSGRGEDMPLLPFIFSGNLETPLQCSFGNAHIRFELDYIQPPSSKILINPKIVVGDASFLYTEPVLFICSHPAVFHDGIYYPFSKDIKRSHLQRLEEISSITIPEPLFGSFVENSLLELKRFGEVANLDILQKFTTVPFTGILRGKCLLSYLNGELEAQLLFDYDGITINALSSQITFADIEKFKKPEGILSRDIVKEKQIIDELFKEFVFEPSSGSFLAKSEKKIVEFMTEIVPKYKDIITFDCPQNLLDKFIYDKTTFTLDFDYADVAGFYEATLEVKGELKGVSLDLLWDCVASSRCYIELTAKNRKNSTEKTGKILVLDLPQISKVIQIFDEIGIKKLDNHTSARPLWTLVAVEESSFKNLPIKAKISDKLKEIRAQMLGETKIAPSLIPASVKDLLRNYQTDGVFWMDRLRKMYLNGILADDMGLGKTLQAIVALTQAHGKNSKAPSVIVCPTSLLYNWVEELRRFNPKLRTIVIDGIPQQRKKVLSKLDDYDVLITSYTLMQKDIEEYQKIAFTYAILDEAQHIKNRATRNAKSVKMLKSTHKLILTGTPIENSLDELWSLFDFLMPGFLSSYDRFLEKYLRGSNETYQERMLFLKKKISPFILRRMKGDVLSDLPPVSEIVYRCPLGPQQESLYRSYAKSARDELTKLVEKEGFDKVQIHVLATLTHLKQICCHPAIFAKEKAEIGDSAKYEMLLDLLHSLIEGGHKTVIFSQYTRMLQIMKEDFEFKGIRFSYLDGSSKNRLQIVNEFNENKDIPVFLVSLKAGGTGLNITGADTVIHYDMWWNPAVENQATDRVHRIGQTKAVSAYKLVTLGSIEEKIVEMQNRKKGLVKNVVSCDDEAISKLTWEEVLELLQT